MLNLLSKINKKSQQYAWEQEDTFGYADLKLTFYEEETEKRANSVEASLLSCWRIHELSKQI